MNWFDGVEPHWIWLGLGLLLAIGEMTIPGVFLIWMAGAALVTGLVAWLVPLAVPGQIALFAVLSILFVFAGRRFLRQHPVEGADPEMNQRGARGWRGRGGQPGDRGRPGPGAVGRQRMDCTWPRCRTRHADAGDRVRRDGPNGRILALAAG